MITITLYSHPEKGKDTTFRIVNCQPGEDPRGATWERTVQTHAIFGGLFMRQAERESEVDTMDVVRECMDYDNHEWPMLLRALGWSEVDLQGMWDEYMARENSRRVQEEAREKEESRDEFETYLRKGSNR